MLNVMDKGLVEKKNGNRIEWIDALRGIATINVIFCHFYCRKITGWENVSLLTGVFIIPLFFAISGYCFNEKNYDIKLFSVGVYKKIILPWIFFITTIFFVMSFVYGKHYFFDSIIRSLYGESYWYIPCLIIAEYMHLFIKYISRASNYLLIVSAIFFLVGVFSYDYLTSIRIIPLALQAQLFLGIGGTIKSDLLPKWNRIIYLVLYLLIATYMYFLHPCSYIDVKNNIYFGSIFGIIYIIIGLIWIFKLFERWNIHNRVLVFVGKNSLLFYIYGMYMQGLVKHLFIYVGVDIYSNLFFITIGSICNCIVCSAIALILNKLKQIIYINRVQKSI